MKGVALAATALMLAGCTTTVAGNGNAAPGFPTSGSPTGSGPPASSTGPGGSTTPTGPTTSAAPAASIGDPNRADLCAAVQLPAYRALGSASFDSAQLAASCYVTITKGSAETVGIDVTAKPQNKAKPRASGRPSTVAGLPVVTFPADQFSCQRDIWLTDAVLSVTSDSLGTTATQTQLCRAADQMVAQVAAAVTAGPLPRRRLASPSLIQLEMCRAIAPGDLRSITGGAPLSVANFYYRTFCRGTNDKYTLGAQVVFRKAADRPMRITTTGGHRFTWFDAVDPASIACEVTSLQKPTTDPRTLEAVDFYLIAKGGSLRGQPLCNALVAEAAIALGRLRLH